MSTMKQSMFRVNFKIGIKMILLEKWNIIPINIITPVGRVPSGTVAVHGRCLPAGGRCLPAGGCLPRRGGVCPGEGCVPARSPCEQNHRHV